MSRPMAQACPAGSHRLDDGLGGRCFDETNRQRQRSCRVRFERGPVRHACPRTVGRTVRHRRVQIADAVLIDRVALHRRLPGGGAVPYLPSAFLGRRVFSTGAGGTRELSDRGAARRHAGEALRSGRATTGLGGSRSARSERRSWSDAEWALPGCDVGVGRMRRGRWPDATSALAGCGVVFPRGRHRRWPDASSTLLGCDIGFGRMRGRLRPGSSISDPSSRCALPSVSFALPSFSCALPSFGVFPADS